MNITKNTVAQFGYTLKSETGDVIESSSPTTPVAYLHGQGNIIAGLERALEGRAEGDQFSVTVPPEDAYGPRKDGSVQRIAVKHLQGARKWKPGMIAHVDTNHPLAGKTLVFDVQVVSVRAASDEELAHGHAHGAGGHHH